MEQIFFYIFAIIAVVSAVAVVVSRNPVHSALFLIVTLLQVAALFVLLRAPFLAAAQVFVYVGAVMVLFLFTVLVLDIGKETIIEYMHSHAFAAVGAVVALFLVLAYVASRGSITVPLGGFGEEALVKNIEVVGRALFTKYIFPFEVVSLLLLIALVGAIVLVMNEKGSSK
ncbi:MAG: NADH-quinone oxidoreductase subunit J [Thermodesulfobacteriota bacterium]